jgi:hypothetical protein
MATLVDGVLQQLVQNIDPGLDKIIAQDSVSPDTITYVCIAEPGTSQDAPAWRIWRIKSVQTSPPTKDVIGCPYDAGRGKFRADPVFACSAREEYIYSQDS